MLRAWGRKNSVRRMFKFISSSPILKRPSVCLLSRAKHSHQGSLIALPKRQTFLLSRERKSLLGNSTYQFRFFSSARQSPQPKPIEQWTKREVQQWLRQSEDFKDIAPKLKLSGESLAKLTEEQLQKELGNLPGSALYNKIQDLRSQEVLRFQGPAPLVATSGATWPYQPPTDMKNVATSLIRHYEAWRDGKEDKQLHPLFLIGDGPGTGKSRMLDEFKSIITASVEKEAPDSPLLARLKNAMVFKISFESGTAYDAAIDKDASIAVGCRMLYQLHGRSNYMEWDPFAKNPQHHKSPGEVLDHLEKSIGGNPSDMTFIILIDGVMKLPHELKSKTSPLAICLASVSKLINRGAPRSFIVACCAMTLTNPFQDVLADSPQLRVYLKTPFVNGRAIIKNPDPLVHLLIDDMGGHGRALEILEECIKTIGTQNPAALMEGVVQNLVNRYAGWHPISLEVRPHIVRAVLSRRKLELKSNIPGTNPPITVEDVIACGLFRLSNGYLECAYVWLYTFAILTGDSHVWRFNDMHEHARKLDPLSPLGVQCWQHFEEFNARFRCLKAEVFAGESVSLDTLHGGAALGESFAKTLIQCQRLRLVKSTIQMNTKEKTPATILGEMETIKYTDLNYLCINGTSASAGDVFASLKLADGGGRIQEVHQYKLVKEPITQEFFDEEHVKCAASDDIYLMFTTASAPTIRLAPLSGIVNKENWEDYYGPFAGRAFRAANPLCPNANTAPRSLLLMVDGIGDAFAERLIRGRPFKDMEECHARTQIPKSALSLLDFSSPTQPT